MSSNNVGLPAVSQEEGAKHKTAAQALGYRLTNRKRALLESALDELMKDKRDPVKALVNRYFDDPIAWLSWLQRMLPSEEPAAAGGNIGNINAMFLQAAQLANGYSAGGRIVDVTPAPGTTGVQDKPSDW